MQTCKPKKWNITRSGEMNLDHTKEFEIRQSYYERIYNSKGSLC